VEAFSGKVIRAESGIAPAVAHSPCAVVPSTFQADTRIDRAMGAVSFWHLTIERPGLSFGDLIWLRQSGRSPRPVQGRDPCFDTPVLIGRQSAQLRPFGTLESHPQTGRSARRTDCVCEVPLIHRFRRSRNNRRARCDSRIVVTILEQSNPLGLGYQPHSQCEVRMVADAGLIE
jgi:hypothetical protein